MTNSSAPDTMRCVLSTGSHLFVVYFFVGVVFTNCCFCCLLLLLVCWTGVCVGAAHSATIRNCIWDCNSGGAGATGVVGHGATTPGDAISGANWPIAPEIRMVAGGPWHSTWKCAFRSDFSAVARVATVGG